MRLLLISNSTNAGEEYLAHAKKQIGLFLGKGKVKALFIPYAAVMMSFDDYERKVQKSFRDTGHDIYSIHHAENPRHAIRDAEAIVVGGGNTWHLLALLQNEDLLDVIRERIVDGIPYLGWSAGSNLACPTIRTTNDMPVIEPKSFRALGLIPFQINPHYLDANPKVYNSENREMRLHEFIRINPGIYVAGLREGTMLLVEGRKVKLLGTKSLRLFREGMKPVELSAKDTLDFLMIKP